MTGVAFLVVMRIFGVPLVVARGDGDLVVAGRARARDRARARFRARALDRALAAGASPEAAPALALRARRLIALPYRRSLGEAYRRILFQAREPSIPSLVTVIPRPSRVAAAGDELVRLAEALMQPAPVAARGVAEALLLLADGTGPLHGAGSEASLRECVARARGDLRLPDGGDIAR
jgi:hypothetical protein